MASNVQKMMEALDKIIAITTEWQGSIPFGEVRKIAEAARKLPLKNCDIGTADEQSERFRSFCNSHMYGFNAPVYRCKDDCPVKMEIDNRSDKLCIYCQFVWAQIPYESEVS